MRRFNLFIVLSLLVVLFTGCGKSDTSSVLRVGMECDYAPYNWTTTEENASDYAVLVNGSDNVYCDGYDVRIASLIAEELDMELEVYKISWDGLIPALASNEIDVIIAGMSPTEERMQTISFTDAYYEEESNIGVVVRSDGPYATATSVEDLDGAVMSAQMGTWHIELLNQIPSVKDTAHLDSFNALMQATVSSSIDGYISEFEVGAAQASQDENLVYIDFEDGNGFEVKEEYTTTAIGLRKDDTQLLENINRSLAKISSEERNAMMEEAALANE